MAILTTVLGMFALDAPVTAQGTMNQLPDPMNSKDLTLYLERYVDPTFDQWIAIENAQDEYYEKFAELRDGKIAEFMRSMGSMQSAMPSREQMAVYMDDLDDVNRLIRRLDVAFFERVIGSLREDQVPGLQRARLARERIRLRSGVSGQMGMGMSLDIWNCIEQVELDEAELALVDVEMREYEQRLTKLLRKWNEQSGRTMLTMFDEIEARGFADMDMSDPENMDRERMQEYMQAIQESFKIALDLAAKEAAKSRALNAATLSKIAAVLDPKTGWKLKRSYLGMTSDFGMRLMAGDMESAWQAEAGQRNGDVVLVIDRLLKETAVPEETRAMLVEMRDGFIIEDTSRIDRLVKGMKEIDPMLVMMESWTTMSSGGEGEVEPNDTMKRVAEMRASLKKREEAAAEARARVAGSIAELKDARLDRIALGFQDDEDPDADLMSMGDDFLAEELAPSGSWVINSMDIRDISRIRRFIGCEDWQFAIVESLHEDYLEEWNSSVTEIEVMIARMEQGTREVVAKKLAEARKARLGGLIRARELDDAFFANLALAMSDEAAPAIQVARADRLHDHSMVAAESTIGMTMAYFPASVSGRPAGPIGIVIDMMEDISPEDREAVLEAVLSTSERYLESARELAEQHFDNGARFEEMMKSLVSTSMSGAEDWEVMQEVGRRNEEKTAPLRERAEKEHEALLDRLAASMPAETYELFEKNWRLKSYPQVYRDPSNCSPIFKRARALGTVSQEQTARILALEVEYELAWEDLCDRMVKQMSAQPRASDWRDPETRDRMMDQMSRMERIQFERDELSVRTLRRLARLLDAEQRSRIRELRALGKEIGDDGPLEVNSAVAQ
ncbi:MAG: hypothetical protein P8J45_05495 [Phycisphaerales bacterium]|nr:hypothetical protein [Phycisphaerales bacterium]